MAQLDLRIMHVKPGMPTKVWDAKLMNGRKDVRVFPNGAGGDAAEFIEIIVLRNDIDYQVTSQVASPWAIVDEDGVGKPRIEKISKSQRRKIARRKNAQKENLQGSQRRVR